jgi:hypothetical protein
MLVFSTKLCDLYSPLLPLFPYLWFKTPPVPCVNKYMGICMDLITIKTPHPKCLLYWCLKEFIDWRYSRSCWYFRTLLCTSVALTFSLVHLQPPPPPPCVNNYMGYVFVQCVTGGGRVSGCVESIYRQTPAAK